MIFPFFKRPTRYKKFHYEPRYYDPIKEEINNRTEQIKRELNKNKEGESSRFTHRESISAAFSKRQTRDRRVSSMQGILIALFVGTFLGFIYYGEKALWVFVILFPVYIFIRSRRFFR